MKPTTTTALWSAVFLLLSTYAAQAQQFDLQWSRVEYQDNLGGANMICRDMDGDGRDELLFSGSTYQGQTLFVTHIENSELKTDWSSRWFSNPGLAAFQTANFDQDADQEIYVILTDGSLEVYDGLTHQKIAAYPGNPDSYVYSGLVADIDQDGHPELVLVLDQSVTAYDLVTQQLDWQRNSLSASSILAGDVDGDGAMELVTSGNSWSGNTGYILNGGNGSTEWQYFGGFGAKIALANVDNDPEQEIVGLIGGQVTYFDGAQHSPIGQFTPNFDLAAITATDIEGDGHDEILIGDGQWGKIHAFSAESQQLLWEISNPNHGVTRIAVGDPDRNGKPDVIWGAGASSSGPDNLYFYEIASQQPLLVSRDLDGPFILDAGQAAPDAALNYFIGSYSSNSGYDNGHLLQYDAESGDLVADFLPVNISHISRMKLVHTRGPGKAELVLGYYNMVIVDAETRETLFEEALGYNFRDIENVDLDDDGRDEIIIGDDIGTIHVYQFKNGSFSKIWQSISYGSYVTSLQVVNVDNDPAPEFVFNTSNGIIQIIDSKTKLLQGQIPSQAASNGRIAVADLDANGSLELVSTDDQYIRVFDLQTLQQIGPEHYSGTSIRAVAVSNVDTGARKEILIFDDRLKVLNSENFETIWQSDAVSDSYGEVSLFVYDLLDDQHIDVLIGTGLGVYHFRSVSKIPDVVPPRVTAQIPAPQAQYQGINSAVKIRFSEPMEQSLLQEPNVLIKDRAGNVLSYTSEYDTTTQTLVCQPVALLPASDTITVSLSALLADLAQNTLDGNRNGIGSGAPDDEVSWWFNTGSGIDTVGPLVLNAALNQAEIWPGLSSTLTASVSDFSTVALSGVDYAEYFIDQPGPDGQGTPLLPNDGKWDEITELAAADLKSDGLNSGTHTVYVHARDLQGNWGVWTELVWTILGESQANWPMFGQNAQHTNYSQNCELVPPLKLKWVKNYTDRQMVPVTYANGRLLAPMAHTSENKSVLHSLDTLDGADKWAFSFGNVFSINPAGYAYGRVYIQLCNNSPGTRIVSLNFNNGAKIWETPFDAQWEKYLGPTIADGKVFINGGSYGGVYCFDALSGQKRWFQPLQQFDEWTPAYYQNTVYTFAGGVLSAFKASTGLELWHKDLPFDFFTYDMRTAPVIDTADNLIFATSFYHLHAVRLDTREIAWEINDVLSVSPALKNGVLYVIVNGKLEARQAATGALIWTFAGDNQLSYPPVLTDDFAFVSSANQVFAVELSTGLKKWNYSAGGALTLAENLLVVTNPDNVIRVFEHGLSSAVEETAAVDFSLTVAPNPVRESARIGFTLPRAMKAGIVLSDLSGRDVARIGEAQYAAGEHFVDWIPADLPAGVYRCSIVAEGFSNTRKVVVLGE